MTDDTDHDHQEHDPPHMTDEDDTDADTENPNEYDKHTVRRFGQRGSPIIEEEQETTDLESMDKEVDETMFSFCNCGAAHTVVDEIYRCCSCDRFCCCRCRILIRRYNYCPDCVQQEYGIDKTAFKALYLLDKGILDPDDLLATETVGDEVVAITVNNAADTLIEQNYLQTGDGHPVDDIEGLDTGDVLSSKGEEALHAGDQLFGDDPDIEKMKERVRIERIADQ